MLNSGSKYLVDLKKTNKWLLEKHPSAFNGSPQISMDPEQFESILNDVVQNSAKEPL